MQVSLWPVLVLLLGLAIPSVGSSSAQSNDTQSSNVPSTITQSNDTLSKASIITDNVTNPVGNVTRNANSTLVNNTETSSLNTTNIAINEVELNPQGGDSDHEWIELYNPTNVDVNASDFEIRTSFKSATIQLSSNVTIEANGTYVVALDGHMLSNTAESLVLADTSGEVIDQTPSLVDRSDDRHTWQRIPDGNDEWQFALDTRNELNDPGEQTNATRSANASFAAECHGTAGCVEGTVTRIVDGDTIYVKVNSTVYKIDLALTITPASNEQGFIDSTSFTRSLCLGSNVLVDQDDKLLASNTSVIAVVYCESTNLNSELLDDGYATLDAGQCQTSEFAIQSWAKEHGC